tara:strand:- start:4208 stop:4546 length:339 start_codon:yes stop_codon:yes gene_type:complete
MSNKTKTQLETEVIKVRKLYYNLKDQLQRKEWMQETVDAFADINAECEAEIEAERKGHQPEVIEYHKVSLKNIKEFLSRINNTRMVNTDSLYSDIEKLQSFLNSLEIIKHEN